jgi:endoglucanase
MIDQNGEPIALRGMSMYCWSNQGTRFYNPQAIDHLARDWKCTVIRIAILPGAYATNAGGEIQKVKTVMDACIANGIYAIVDWHAMEGAQNDLPSAENFFTTVAAAYGKTPNLMYEPWNEPVFEPWPVIKAYHEAVIAKIRALDPDNIIICGNRNWDQQCAEASRDPITSSSNIAYSIHFYAATHRADLRKVGDAALKNGVALFATEYGTCAADGSGGIDRDETRRWWKWLKKNDISCANWSVAALPETSAAFRPDTTPIGPWTDSVLSPSGLFVRDYLLREYQSGR